MDAIEAVADTAAVWVLVFRRTSELWWARYIGRYKHVAAYAYVPGLKLWLFYEVSTQPTSIVVLPDGQHVERMARFIADADLVAMRRNPATPMRFRRRLAFHCVTAIRDLIGLDSGALLVDRLYRDCLAAGGEPFGRSPEISGAAAVG
jgi:hypothetical protein